MTSAPPPLPLAHPSPGAPRHTALLLIALVTIPVASVSAVARFADRACIDNAFDWKLNGLGL